MSTPPGPSPSNALWRARFFGAFQLASGREVLTKFESKRAIALLVFLLLHEGDPQTREVLADRLWPEIDPTTGRNRLKQTLASLRRQLEPPGMPAESVLIADRNSIMLRQGAIESDFQEFVAAESQGDFAALHRFAGEDFLPGLYDEWLDDLRLWVDAVQERSQTDQPRDVIRLQKTPSVATPGRIVRLPTPTTPTFGRETETARLLAMVQEFRLVTVTGIGGTGKTRLSVQTATKAPHEVVCFVGLAEVSQPELIVPTINAALGLAAAAKLTPFQVLQQALSGRSTLLLLDNLEQLVGANTAQELGRILAECPTVSLLVTSRIPVGVESEADFPLYPLPVLAAKQTLEALAESPAARFFVERARRSRADFQITERNHEAVLNLLNHLGGMPLAIELCAAWAHVLSPSQMLGQMQQGADLLVSKRKDVPSRQRSLENAFASTVSLLPEDQRRLLVRLGAFRGGVRLELLLEVVGELDLSESLSGLAKAALIQPVPEGDGFRYTLLESLRQFTAQLPDPDGLRQTTQARLFDVLRRYASLAAQRLPAPELGVKTEGDWWRMLRSDWDNVRAAVQFGLTHELAAECVPFIEDLEWFSQVESLEGETVAWLEQCLEALHDDPLARHRAEVLLAYARRKTEPMVTVRARLEALLPRSRATGGKLLTQHLWRIANLSANLAVDETNDAVLQEALTLATEAHDPATECRVRMLISHAHALQGEIGAAEAELDLAAECARTARLQNELVYVNHDRAKRYCENGLFVAAVEVLDEVLSQETEVVNKRLLSRCYNLMGEALYAAEQWDAAFIAYAEAVVRHADIQDATGAMYPLWNLGIYLVAQNHMRMGAQFLGAAHAVFLNYHSDALDEVDQHDLNAAMENAASILTPEVARALYRRGKAMSLADIRKLALDLKASISP